jgi:predicted nuclease of predicted toxin-antitoxin system
MRLKVDENLPVEVADLLRAAGHDAATVNDEGVGGATDPDLADLVRRRIACL